MTLSLSKLQQYAKTRNTKVIARAYKIADDYKSAVFVLESGPKLTMSEKEIDAALEAAAEAKRIEDAIEEVKHGKTETAAEKRARLKAEAKAASQGDEGYGQ